MASKQASAAPSEVVHAISREAQVELWQNMIMAVPGVESDGFEIIARIMAADTWEDTEVGKDGLPSTEEQLGKELRFETVERRESDKDKRSPWYFVVDATDTRTGEQIRFSTGSQTIMAQLAKWYVSGWLPMVARVEQADKETNAGYRPFALVPLASYAK